MELQIFLFRNVNGDPPRLLAGASCPMIPGLLVPRPGSTCPGGGTRRLTCNHLGNHSPQAYEVENKEVALVETYKNVQSTLPYMRL